MIKYKDIRSIQFEISTRCNAVCPMCPRNASGYQTDTGFPLTELTLTDVKKILPIEFILQLNHILFNGNFGDFIAARDALEIVRYITESNKNLSIMINTNGSARSTKWWQELGSLKNIQVGFDLDGLKDTHHLYRRNTNWDTIIKNAQAFMSAGGHAIWRFIHFKHNEHQIDDCKKLAKELGFARFDILYGGRTDSPVYNIKTGKYEYTIGIEMADIPKTALDHQLHKFNYRSPEKRIEFYKTVKVSESIDCLAKKQKEIYITATGDVYPCCYFGHYPTIPEYKQYWQMDNFAITPLIKNNNALEYGIEEAIKWFNSVEESWSKQSYLEGRLYKCDEFCGVNSVIDTKRHRL